MAEQDEIAEEDPKFDCPKHLECDVTNGYMIEHDLDEVMSYASIENEDLKKKPEMIGVYVDITLDVLSRRCKITEEDKKHLWETYRLYTAKIPKENPYICRGHFREHG